MKQPIVTAVTRRRSLNRALIQPCFDDARKGYPAASCLATQGMHRHSVSRTISASLSIARHARHALRSGNTELHHVSPECFRCPTRCRIRRSLVFRIRPRRLLLNAFGRNEPHRGTGHGFADGFGVGSIRFATLHVCLDVDQGDDPHLVPACPGSREPRTGRSGTLQRNATAGERSRRGWRGKVLASCRPPQIR